MGSDLRKAHYKGFHEIPRVTRYLAAMPPLLSHQKLKVYGKALSLAASLAWHSSQWDKRRAIVDQVGRASESNLAESYGRTARAGRARFLDIAEAAAVKAATYRDLWASKAEWAAEQAAPKLELLERVVRIVRGLLPRIRLDDVEAKFAVTVRGKSHL